MKRARIRVRVVLAVLLLGGCGDGAAPSTDPALWVQRADQAFRDAEESARQARAAAGGGTNDGAAAHRADAVARWKEASRHYRNAFRLEEPVEARASVRALLAFRIGLSMSNAARKRPAERSSEGWAQEALLWLRQAERIHPGMRQVHFERALLYESEIGQVRNIERARAAYEAYVTAAEAEAELPASEEPRVERARERLKELAPPELK